jgi:porin
LVAQSLPVSADSGDPLLDNFGNVRSTLDKYGISLGLQSTDEVFGNPNGGRAQGATFDGQTALGLGIDLEKATDLKGGIFNVGAFQNCGHGISASNIDNLSLVSNIEATRSARLYELWYQQSFFGGYGARSINAAFGSPTLPTIDLPAGGPAFPLATPGIRLRVNRLSHSRSSSPPSTVTQPARASATRNCAMPQAPCSDWAMVSSRSPRHSRPLTIARTTAGRRLR